MEFVTIDKSEGIAYVKVNRPKALNALNAQVFNDLEEAMIELAACDETRVVIITGEGEKAFVAGADIKELSGMDPITAKTLSARGQSVFRRVENMNKPVIAAINGFALGGGCELALACHMRVASEKAKLGLPEVGLGLIPGYAGTQRLPRLVGKGLAMELTLTGDMVNASRALEIGLVNYVTSSEDLMAKCEELAHKMMSKGPVAQRYAIEAINQGYDLSELEGENVEANLFGIVASSEDALEGTKAFIEKRKAEFKGK